MKRFVTAVSSLVAVAACSGGGEGVVLDEFAAGAGETAANAEALCDEIAAAASYDEFRAARAKLDDYREAYRTQLGGEAYTEFLELCKESLNI